ncbi:MAG: 4-hydroxythreonine-4-phosphate dehydrogenase PdxA, partial [Muribaculaceae bacterium]|nr:4-hydroxythreonine-4-phosphate dehydrogenase PdxA [Muribaculaceae bacterium]
MTNDKIIRVGITQGDTNGIGYEVILKTLQSPQITELFTPVVYGSAKTASYHRKALELQPVSMNVIKSGADIKDGVNNLVEVTSEEVKVDLGMPSEYAGKAAFDALEHAVSDLKQGYIDVLVTAPINKKSIQSDQFTFPGHTEYLEASIGDGDKALMILFSENVRVALVTTHVPVANVSSAITKELVLEKIIEFNDSLKRDFGVVRPRIAVLALNP